MAPTDLSSPPPRCKICSLRPSKYQCPRCYRRTCSLACCKRHKRLYDCTGVRDPIARLSRAQLTRGDAYDQDYNFLTSVERAFENADRADYRRDFAQKPVEGDGSHPIRTKGNRFAEALRSSGVHIHRLPNGMSRKRVNDTHWMIKRKQIKWTVEWLHPDGTKSIGQCNSKTHPTNEYTASFLAPSRKPSTQHAKRRKIGDSDPSIKIEPEIIDASNQESAPPPPLHFYLVKPFTRGKEKVLIPIDGKSLNDALSQQEIIEFPTIQVLAQAADGLPEGFVLERHYSGHGIELIGESDSKGQEAPEKSAPLDVAPVKVMESLRKDIAALS